MAAWTDPALRTQSIYQIFPRNFTREGTLDAAAAELPRIRDMGFDIVYLTPLHPIGALARKGPEGSPYAIRDYLAIDGQLGGEPALARFAEAAHALGLKLIIDVVYNHCAPDSALVAEHPEWFIKGADGKPSRKVEDWSDVVDFDFKAPGLREYLIRALEKWLGLGVDGFRCDVASLVPADFWVEARKRAEAVKPTVWLAESVHKEFVAEMRARGHYAACDAELHEAFDITYDYDGREDFDRWVRGEAPISAYLHHLELQLCMYPAHAIKARCLENHDQRRVAELVPQHDRLRNLSAMAMLLPGTFFAYMGQEWALDRKPDLFSKDVIDRASADRGFERFFIAAHRALKPVRADAVSWKAREVAAGVVAAELGMKTGPAVACLFNLDGRRGWLDGKAAGLAGLAGRDVLSGRDIRWAERVELGAEPVVLRRG